MINCPKFLLIIGLILSPLAYANNHAEDTAYANMQNCLANAEQDANLNSQLDRYCIDSYLATRPDKS